MNEQDIKITLTMTFKEASKINQFQFELRKDKTELILDNKIKFEDGKFE